MDSPQRGNFTFEDTCCEAWEAIQYVGEVWKDIEGYEGKYQVSSFGRVRHGEDILNPFVTEKGYCRVGLSKDGKAKKCRVHRLVAEAFIPNPEGYSDVHHIDEDRKHNAVTNLVWAAGNKN